jgi:hypothetical protein
MTVFKDARRRIGASGRRGMMDYWSDSMKGRHPFRVAILIRSIVPFVLFLIIFCTAHRSTAGSDFIDFYPTAEARTQSPPDLSSLSILCREKKFGRQHVTFVGDPNKKVLLVVFTDKRVKDLTKVITLKTVFVQDSKKSFPKPSARVGPDATLDWAYVYDRNGDGRLDYLAFLFAAIPVKPDDFPSDYPTGGRITSFEQIELTYRHSRLLFSHHADDNFDGSSDAVVAAVLDPDRYPWVEQFGVLRSTKFDGNVDETWTFKKSIAQRTGTVAQRDQHYILQNAPDTKLMTGKEWLGFGTELMQVINDFARKCGLAKESFQQK